MNSASGEGGGVLGLKVGITQTSLSLSLCSLARLLHERKSHPPLLSASPLWLKAGEGFTVTVDGQAVEFDLKFLVSRSICIAARRRQQLRYGIQIY